jgi:hypothetical protein
VKTLLIVTGPQGSGNHLFSKLFSLHPDVFGWSELLQEYWIGHDKEPFANAWHEPTLLKDIHFDNFAVTSISAPYAYKGQTVIPDYKSFIDSANSLGYNTKFAIVGRDRNILEHQQSRVRGRISLCDFESQLPYLSGLNPIYISQELIYLYRMPYLQSLSSLLQFPVSDDNLKVEDILKNNSNSKYFTACNTQDLDYTVRRVSGLNN